MAMNAQAYKDYKKTTVESASPGKLLLMLYDGLIKDVDIAREAIEKKDINTAHNRLMNAQDIMLELMSTLNMDYEISKELLNLYSYLRQQLAEANLKKDGQILSDIRGIIVDLRDTWREAIKKAGSVKLKDQTPDSSVEGFDLRG